MVDELVGGIVVDETLRGRVEIQGSAQAKRARSDVDDGAAVVAVVLRQGEFLTGLHAVEEVRVARLRIWNGVDDIHHVRDGALESFVNLAVRAFDVRHLALAFKALALKDDLAAVGVGVGDAPPYSHSVRMLLRSVHLDLHREGVILAETRV